MFLKNIFHIIPLLFKKSKKKKIKHYKFNNERGIAPDYGALGQGKGKDYIDPKGNIILINNNEGCYNCNSFMNTIAERLEITNFNRDMPGLDPGSNTIIDGKYFKKIKLDRQK